MEPAGERIDRHAAAPAALRERLRPRDQPCRSGATSWRPIGGPEMARWADTEPDWDDDDDVDGDLNVEDDEEEPTIPCPYCRREIHEDSQRCPYCEHYISSEDAPVRRPWWLVLGVGACLYVVYRW